MKKAIKKLWLKALRSGKYKQIRNVLKDDYECGYCCLGVLCELYLKDHPKVSWKDFDSHIVEIGDTLPDEVQKWAGFDTDNPSVNLPDFTDIKLSELNDGEVFATHKRFKPFDFNKIANVIEKHF